MKKTITIALSLIVLISLIGSCASCSKVPAGNVGIKVYLLGKSKGVDTEELGVGRYWIGVNKELYLFPTFQQNYVWTKNPAEGSKNDESFTFQTTEGMECNADVGISYHLDPEKISKIFQKYRKGIEEITDIYMRNHVRDAFNAIASTYKVEAVYGKGKTELINQVLNQIKPQLADQGIMIDKLYWIGSIRLPDTVVKALNLKIEATQRAEQRENELREAEAQARKKIAEAKGVAESSVALARGKSTANRLLNSSISSQLIQWEKLELEKQALQKWNGILPTHMIPEKSMPFIGVGK